MPETVDKVFELDQPLYGQFQYYIHFKNQFKEGSLEAKVAEHVIRHNSSIRSKDVPDVLKLFLERKIRTGFLLVGDSDDLPVRDLYTLGKGGGGFHLGRVKEPFSTLLPAICYTKFSGRGEELNNIGARLREGGHVDKLLYDELQKKPKAEYFEEEESEQKINLNHLFYPAVLAVAAMFAAAAVFVGEQISDMVRKHRGNRDDIAACIVRAHEQGEGSSIEEIDQTESNDESQGQEEGEEGEEASKNEGADDAKENRKEKE